MLLVIERSGSPIFFHQCPAMEIFLSAKYPFQWCENISKGKKCIQPYLLLNLAWPEVRKLCPRKKKTLQASCNHGFIFHSFPSFPSLLQSFNVPLIEKHWCSRSFYPQSLMVFTQCPNKHQQWQQTANPLGGWWQFLVSDVEPVYLWSVLV